MKKVERIGVTEILGREIVFYDSWEDPLFLGKDVAEWIDYAKTSKGSYDVSSMLNPVDDDEKLIRKIFVSGQNRDMKFLTEEGLYDCLMQSTKPIAKQLKKKIKQYLKQIRKTGGVVEEGREEEFVEKYFPSFSEEVKLSMVQDLLKQNKELKPKAEYHDEVLQNPKLKPTTDIAKDLGMSAQKLHKILHEKEIIYPKKIDGKIKGWYLYSKYDHLVPEYADYKINQHGQQLQWTEKGRKLIINLVKEKVA